MPLETATYISQLVSTNPAGTDSEAQGDDHLRLIKACLQATFPNFTAAALNSTQAAIDAVATAFTNGTWPLSAGSVSAPALSLAADPDTGVYSKGVGKINVTVEGTDLLEMNATGLNLSSGTLQFAGVNVFPLASSAYGAGSILTAALGAAQVTYPKIQNVAASSILANPTGSPATVEEVTLDSGTLAFSGTTLQGLVKHASSRVVNLLVVNDGTTPNTKLDVTADEAVLVDGSGKAIKHTAVSVIIDSTTTGANGCDTGTRVASQPYDVYLISNGTTIAGLLVKEGNTPSMPGGYTFKKKVSWQVTDGSSNFARWTQRNGRAQFTFTGSNSFPVISSGNHAGWLAVSLSGLCPLWASEVTVQLNIGNGGNGGVAPNNNYSTASNTGEASNSAPLFFTNGSTPNGNNYGSFVLESTSIYYTANSNVANAAMLTGFEVPL